MEKNPFDESEVVISATECMGILPALPMDDAPDAQQSAAASCSATFAAWWA